MKSIDGTTLTEEEVAALFSGKDLPPEPMTYEPTSPYLSLTDDHGNMVVVEADKIMAIKTWYHSDVKMIYGVATAFETDDVLGSRILIQGNNEVQVSESVSSILAMLES